MTIADHPPATGPDAMTPVPHRVVDRTVDTLVGDAPDTVTITLDPLEHPLPTPRPGQFAMLWVFGVGEVPISYAGLADSDGRGARHTIRAVGATTRALVDLGPGAVVGVRGPFGTDWGLDAAVGRDVVVVAGGIGLAPLRPLVEAALAERDRFGHLTLLVGARSPDQVLYRDALAAWGASDAIDIGVTVDHAPPAWQGEVGVVTALLSRLTIDPGDATAFVCGPEVMVRYAAGALGDRGVAAADIRVSLERNMACALAHCGRCQLGGVLVCRDGPVLTWDRARPLLGVRER